MQQAFPPAEAACIHERIDVLAHREAPITVESFDSDRCRPYLDGCVRCPRAALQRVVLSRSGRWCADFIVSHEQCFHRLRVATAPQSGCHKEPRCPKVDRVLEEF